MRRVFFTPQEWPDIEQGKVLFVHLQKNRITPEVCPLLYMPIALRQLAEELERQLEKTGKREAGATNLVLFQE